MVVEHKYGMGFQKVTDARCFERLPQQYVSACIDDDSKVCLGVKVTSYSVTSTDVSLVSRYVYRAVHSNVFAHVA